MTEKIILKVQETANEFIFLTIQPFCEEVLERKISKQELEKILIDYKNGVAPVGMGNGKDIHTRVFTEWMTFASLFSETE